jgi:hypothetical protein
MVFYVLVEWVRCLLMVVFGVEMLWTATRPEQGESDVLFYFRFAAYGSISFFHAS